MQRDSDKEGTEKDEMVACRICRRRCFGDETPFKITAKAKWQELVCTSCKLRGEMQKKPEGKVAELCTKQTAIEVGLRKEFSLLLGCKEN